MDYARLSSSSLHSSLIEVRPVSGSITRVVASVSTLSGEEDFIGIDIVLFKQRLSVCLALVVMVEVAVGPVSAAAEREELAAVAFGAVHPREFEVCSFAVGHVAGVLHVLVAVLSVLPLAVVSRVLSWKLAREWLHHRLIAASSGLRLCWCGVETGSFLSKGSHGLLILLLERGRGWNWCSSKWGWSAGWTGNSFVSDILCGG